MDEPERYDYQEEYGSPEEYGYADEPEEGGSGSFGFDPFVETSFEIREQEFREEEEEYQTTFRDFERTAVGRCGQVVDLRRIQRNPKEFADYSLECLVPESIPFRDMEFDSNVAYLSLRDIPDLETKNMALLLAAYLYRQRYSEGKITSKEFTSFYKPFGEVYERVDDPIKVSRVDLLRYIRLYDKYIEGKK